MAKNNYEEKNYDRQPIIPLLIEAVGLLLVGISMINGLSQNPDASVVQLLSIDNTILVIGLGLVVLSFLGFCIFKQKNDLFGIGKLGFVISVIGFVLVIIVLIFTFLLIFAIDSIKNIA